MPQKTKKPYIYLRKDGRYEGRYKQYLSADKKNFKQVSVYGATYEEALEKTLRGQAFNSNSMHTRVEKPFLIKELMEPWLLDIRKTMKPSSYTLYQSYAEKYLLPKIGDRYITDFDESALIALLKSFQERKENGSSLAQTTVYLLEEMIRALFRYGAEKKLIPEIYFGKVKYNIQSKKDAIPLSEMEVQQLLYVLQQQKMDLQIQVMLPLYTGVSLSELCGLKWEDMDLESGTISIHRNLKRIQQVSEQKNGKAATIMEEYELSEKECRRFVMPEKLSRLLEIVIKEQRPTLKEYVAALHVERKAALPDGRTLQYRLKAIGEQVGIPELTFRRLRDTFVVMCLKVGGDVYSLAYVLGITVSALCSRYGAWLVRNDGFLKEIG